jgi:RimJ/RimL family protein N-acetyltransferase
VAENHRVPAPDWLSKPTLTGGLVRLRPFTGDDVDAMRDILADPELLKLTGSVHGSAETEPNDDERLVSWYSTRATADERLDLAVIDLASDALVGEVVLNEWDAGNNSCNFRTLIGPAGRGRGLGTEATRLIVGYGFEVLGLHRISLDVFAFNPRAQRVYAKVGFVTEGVSREAFRWEDEWIDEISMSILAREWAQHRGFPKRHPKEQSGVRDPEGALGAQRTTVMPARTRSNARAFPGESSRARCLGAAVPRTTAWMCSMAYWNAVVPSLVQTVSLPAAVTSSTTSWTLGWNGFETLNSPFEPTIRVNVDIGRRMPAENTRRRPPGKSHTPAIAMSTADPPADDGKAVATAAVGSVSNSKRAKRIG